MTFKMQIRKYDKVLSFFFVAALIGSFLIWSFEAQFDEEKWRTDPSRRYKIADDIIDSDLLIGMSKLEVIDLLGEPVDLIETEVDLINYKIGAPPSFSKSVNEQLVIIFENAKVVEVFRIRTDE
ncbi:MAG: hypothetical protein WA775_06885 [Psychroserpens sp.]|uniref:hypothetical protein n=1 Tax=Psychroserpens sp. TaxID=2020870 RepID=UPI003C84BE2B